MKITHEQASHELIDRLKLTRNFGCSDHNERVRQAYELVFECIARSDGEGFLELEFPNDA